MLKLVRCLAVPFQPDSIPQLRFCLDASLITDDALASRQDRMRWKRKHQLRLLLAVVILRCWLMLMRKDAQPRASHIEMPSSALGWEREPESDRSQLSISRHQLFFCSIYTVLSSRKHVYGNGSFHRNNRDQRER